MPRHLARAETLVGLLLLEVEVEAETLVGMLEAKEEMQRVS